MVHILRTSMMLHLPIHKVFSFFCDITNLERITPPELHFRVLPPHPEHIENDTLINYRLRLFGIGFRWQSRIRRWDPPHEFVDEQTRGPYKTWVHTHHFHEHSGSTQIEDCVCYRLPLWPIGELAYPLVQTQLKRIFRYREETIRACLCANCD